MDNELQPYYSYKSSGVEWLGDVPSHWEVLPNRAVFAEVIEKNSPSVQMLSVTITNGVIRQQELLEDSSKKDVSRLDRSQYKLVYPGDIAYNKMRAWQGAVGMSQHKGIVSPAYVVQRPRNGTNSRYLHYLLRTPAWAKEAERWSYGITSDMWSLRPEHFKMIHSCLPPAPEQASIVSYLDRIDERIRRYVSKKELLIQLLEREKHAIIDHAVTRGLDSNVRLKPSGGKAIGDVPKHWDVVQLGRIGDFYKGGGGTKEDEVDIGFPCIRYGDLYMDHKFHIEQSRSCISRERVFDYTPIEYGDILFAGSGETIDEIGKSAVNLITGDAYCGGDVILFRTRVEANPRFMGYAIDCTQSTYQKACMGRGITVMHIYSSELKYMHLALPPVDEQTEIARYLDKTTARIDGAISRTRRQIELVQEYRTRLIADVVTGKLDVRRAEVGSHDEADTLKPLREVGEITGGHRI